MQYIKSHLKYNAIVFCWLYLVYRNRNIIKTKLQSQLFDKFDKFDKFDETDIPPDCHNFQRVTKNLYLGGEYYFFSNENVDLSYFDYLIACNYRYYDKKDKKDNKFYYNILWDDGSISEASKKLNELLNKNKKVLVYCDHGNSRSRWVVVDYLSKYYKNTIDEDFNLRIIENKKYNDLKQIYSENLDNNDLFDKILDKTKQCRKNI